MYKHINKGNRIMINHFNDWLSKQRYFDRVFSGECLFSVLGQEWRIYNNGNGVITVSLDATTLIDDGSIESIKSFVLREISKSNISFIKYYKSAVGNTFGRTQIHLGFTYDKNIELNSSPTSSYPYDGKTQAQYALAEEALWVLQIFTTGYEYVVIKGR